MSDCAKCLQMRKALLAAKAELEHLEGAVDAQTHELHRRNLYDTPDDAELEVVITAADERRLNRAIAFLQEALRW